MSNIDASPKKSLFKKWWFWLIAVVLFFGFIGMLTPDATQNNAQQNEPSSNEPAKNTNSLSNDKSSYELDGFTVNTVQSLSDTQKIVIYTPNDSKNYSVTTSINSPVNHDEKYTVDRNTTIIDGIEIKTAYNDDYILNGSKLDTAYRSLSFDFKKNDITYSGEISNLIGEASKDETMEILEKFVLAIPKI